jgi:hypothetical protein
MTTMTVQSVGQIREADITFGDLTVLVGPQATGKSIFLQLFKLTQDGSAIKQRMKKYGFDWRHEWDSFLSLYFGEGMQSMWSSKSHVSVDSCAVDFEKVIYWKGRIPPETVFLIPAQRVIVLKSGWPRPFMDYAASDPFCVRSFSEHIRQLMEVGLGKGGAVFPQKKRLKKAIRDSLDGSLFNGATVRLDTDGFQKRLVLDVKGTTKSLPYMAWSAGQREFMPLLLGLYWLMPSTATSKKKDVRWVIVEEPEMGLHPQAIFSFMLLVLELIGRGYKVILSTHSPIVLDVVWAIREMKASGAKIDALRSLFQFSRWHPGLQELFENVLKKEYRTYFFNKASGGVGVEDISNLDPGADSDAEAGWGGLTGFSGRAADVVAEYCGATR